LCTGVGQPCRGCFGKAEAVYDPGAKMVSAISSTFDSDNKEQIVQMTAKLNDLSGTFYRYTSATQCALLDKD
jgi:F420-non-reducing hydrogenase small subunit